MAIHVDPAPSGVSRRPMPKPLTEAISIFLKKAIVRHVR
jgi:hypothetical protein